jgi:hypothetical protein
VAIFSLQYSGLRTDCRQLVKWDRAGSDLRPIHALPVIRPVTLSISAVDLALLSRDGGIRRNIEVSVARVAASFFLQVSWHLWVAPQPTPSSKHRFLKP